MHVDRINWTQAFPITMTLICVSLPFALQGVIDGAAGPSCSSDHQKPSSNSGTTEAVTLQQPDQQQQQREEEEEKMSLELTLSFAYM